MATLSRFSSRWSLPAGLVLALIWSGHLVGQDAATSRLDRAQELVMKIAAPFSIAAVGDVFGAMAPITPLAEPRLQGLLKVIRDADVGFANAESSIADLPRFQGPFGGLLAPKAAAADLKAMGIRIAARANNHVGDNTSEGMFATNVLLDEVGIVHAGTGRNLEEARDAAYLMTSKGRVGLVSLMPISDDAPGGDNQGASFQRTAASSRSGNVGGAPGLNPLRLTTYHIVRCQQRAGIALIDVSGHRVTDALLAAMLHQAFLLGALYELDLFGKITKHLFENLNTRFYASSGAHKYVSMIYGEISEDSGFQFLSAGQPFPAVFSYEHDRFMEVSPLQFPPLGILPSLGVIDRNTTNSPLGFKEHYELNEWSLMGAGDIVLLHTDGLVEHTRGDMSYFPDRLEDTLRQIKEQGAAAIFDAIKEDLLAFSDPSDDISLVVIKRT